MMEEEELEKLSPVKLRIMTDFKLANRAEDTKQMEITYRWVSICLIVICGTLIVFVVCSPDSIWSWFASIIGAVISGCIASWVASIGGWVVFLNIIIKLARRIIKLEKAVDPERTSSGVREDGTTPHD